MNHCLSSLSDRPDRLLSTEQYSQINALRARLSAALERAEDASHSLPDDPRFAGMNTAMADLRGIVSEIPVFDFSRVQE